MFLAHVVSAWLIYWITLRLGRSRTAAATAALLFAAHPALFEAVVERAQSGAIP